MKHLLVALIRLYQIAVSPLLQTLCGLGCGCRFLPSCSQYFIEALHAHGAARGSCLGIRRILRCHPWGESGHDPVPPAFKSASH
jgi:putative membrane protein insertion efficiency factor